MCDTYAVHSLIYAASTIEQFYPKTDKYSCHYPHVKLKCTFSEDPLTASFTVLVNGRDPELVTTSTPGHTVDASEIQSGALYLEVNSAKQYSEGNSYSCAAVYPNGETEESDVFPIPLLEG